LWRGNNSNYLKDINCMVINEILVEQLLNESESTTLDFKEQQYKFIHASDDEKSEFLKDILSFANAFRRTDAFILIGVREIKGDRSMPVGIHEDIDDATLQQFVNHKTHKPVNFSCYTIPFQGVKLGIIQVPIQERPFYLRKDYGKLKKNVVYIRRGTSTGEASLDEVARMSIFLGTAQTYEPILKLQFVNGSDQANFELTRFEKFTAEDSRTALEEFKSKYPKEISNSVTFSTDLIPSIGQLVAQTMYSDPKIKEEYFKYLDHNYSEWAREVRQCGRT
jgi:predicted HTH transcriptional regulator